MPVVAVRVQFSVSTLTKPFSKTKRPGVRRSRLGLRVVAVVFVTVRFTPLIPLTIRLSIPRIFELVMTTGSVVLMTTAGVATFRLSQFPVYVPPWVMTIGGDHVFPGKSRFTSDGAGLTAALHRDINWPMAPPRPP